jgi:hypothetical protein
MNSVCLLAVLGVSIFLNTGCGMDAGVTCSEVACSDALTVRLSPKTAFLPGTYAIEYVGSDEVSIQAAFEIKMEATEAGDESGEVMVVWAIPNDAFPISWSIYDGLPDYVEVQYWGEIPGDDAIHDYELTDQLMLTIEKDGTPIFSESITPEYERYWCNQEAGKCDQRRNKRAVFGLKI